MSRRTRVRARIPIPPEKKKVSCSISMEPALKEKFDKFVKENKFSSRAEALQRLLDVVERVDPVEPSNAVSPRKSAAKVTAKATTRKSSSRKTRASLSGWTKAERARLQSAVQLVRPTTNEHWETVASLLESDHSAEDCRLCAEVEFGHAGAPSSSSGQTRKRTLRSREAMDFVVKKAIREKNPAANDFFHDAPVKLENKIPLAGLDDISCLNTPSSAVSCRSRFALDKSLLLSTPDDSLKDRSTVGGAGLGSTAKKRAIRCVYQMRPVISKAKPILYTPKAKPKPGHERMRRSQKIDWLDERSPADSSELELTGDAYFDDD